MLRRERGRVGLPLHVSHVLHQAPVPGPASHLHVCLIVAVDRQDTKNQCKALRTEQKHVVQSLLSVEIASAEASLCRNNPEVKRGLKFVWRLWRSSLPSAGGSRRRPCPHLLSVALPSCEALGASLLGGSCPAQRGGDASEKAAGFGEKKDPSRPAWKREQDSTVSQGAGGTPRCRVQQKEPSNAVKLHFSEGLPVVLFFSKQYICIQIGSCSSTFIL